MNYELLIERARHAAKEAVCLVEPRILHQMADALENQEKVIKSLEDVIKRQSSVNLKAVQTTLDLDQAYAELAEERYRFDRLSDFDVAEAQELAKVKAERDWLFELVEGQCISCKHHFRPSGVVNCSRCKKDADYWAYAWEGE